MNPHTGIEWTEATWNPTTGCDRVSPGCDHCYALTLAARLKAMGSHRYQRDGRPRTSGPGFGVTMHWDKLREPAGWRKPRIVFVNSMSDLFHPQISDEFIAEVFETMRSTPQHTFQVLTKRPARMASLLSGSISAAPNVWVGTSVEDQEWADTRIPKILATPATVRFLSCEPLLGPIDLSRYLGGEIGWVIVGGESGGGARPMAPEWARAIRDACLGRGTPFFFKQWGGRTPKAGGRLLDGRHWDSMPNIEDRGERDGRHSRALVGILD
jgi:protein gp37